jgi:hypothetical protein
LQTSNLYKLTNDITKQITSAIDKQHQLLIENAKMLQTVTQTTNQIVRLSQSTAQHRAIFDAFTVAKQNVDVSNARHDSDHPGESTYLVVACSELDDDASTVTDPALSKTCTDSHHIGTPSTPTPTVVPSHDPSAPISVEEIPPPISASISITPPPIELDDCLASASY